MSILFSQNLSKYNEIRPQEDDFTEVLASIAPMPKMLYFYGKMPQNLPQKHPKEAKSGPNRVQNSPNDEFLGGRRKVLAIVGSRKPTKYGEAIAYELAYMAAKRGAVVVSGLAYGLDSVAHRGALDAGGLTVAVLGTPIDQIYPKEHLGLARRIVENGGAVMSELAPGAKFYPKVSFLERNRIISGLADVVVIPEAAERSGSLNTAAHALTQGREVFAAPGDIDKPMSKGCNRLILQGATPYLGPDDVLNLLFPAPKKRKMQQIELFGNTPAETAILQTLAAGVRDGEEIIVRSGLDAVEFNQAITMLEIEGRVKALGMNNWVMG